MEGSVQAVENSDGRIAVKKSRNSESKDAIRRSGEKRCNEERKESENEFSLERKVSFKELRKTADEMEDVPNLSSRQGQVSLVLESKEKLPNMKKRREEEKEYPEGNAEEEPGNLRLSQIKIQQWTTPNVKQNNHETLVRLKQICSALEGDDIYHYENIDDFDDTTENYQSKQFKKSPLRPSPKKLMFCKYKLDENGEVITTGVACKGSPNEHPHDTDLRLYFIGEFFRKAETVKCLQRGCDNLYDPWDVLEFAGTKEARKWFLNNANDPLRRKHTTPLPPITRKQYLHKRHYKEPSVPESDKDYEMMMYWVNGESKTKKKSKLLKHLKSSMFSKHVRENDSEAREAKAEKLLKYKHVCGTCWEGTNEKLESGGLKCGHYTCKPCLRYYFNEKMKKKITKMKCPYLGCHEEFRKRFILDVLDFIPLRNAYVNLYDKRREMGLEKSWSSSNSSSDEENHENPTSSKVPNSSSKVKSNRDCKKCPGCNKTVIHEETDEESCNIVLCGCCMTQFCWVCGKKCIAAFHLYKCPLYGKRKYGKGRRVANCLGYSAGLAIGIPIVGSLVVGSSAATLAALVTVGALSPPVLLAQKMKKCRKIHTSATRRRLWVMGAAGLGVLALPVLSAWGVFKTVVTATKRAEEILRKCAEDDEGLSFPTLDVEANASELNHDAPRGTRSCTP